MPIELPELPYAIDALEPYISAETLEYHHGKHHRAYVTTVNEMIAGTPDDRRGLDEIVMSASGKLFNNAAQAWNHSCYWRSLRPGGGGQPGGAVLAALERSFGSYDDFAREFRGAAVGHFGSGWVWLVRDGADIAVTTTHDADLPLVHGATALAVCDVWEHAYYVDYRNRRADYVQAFLDHLIDWGTVAAGLASAA